MLNFFKKYHKWLGIFLAFLLILFSISGIILNHRQLLSSVDVSRKYLPSEYAYKNWNNASVIGSLRYNNDSILLYGNAGVLFPDSTFRNFSRLNDGFANGTDNFKINDLSFFKNRLIAATQFGLFEFNFQSGSWTEVQLPLKEKRIVDLLVKGDSLLLMSRSHLLVTSDFKKFNTIQIPAPENYDNLMGLFKTLWVIHSGEIYGEIGRILVDVVAVVFIFLTVTGLIFFFKKRKLKLLPANSQKKQKVKKQLKWNLLWHNKLGWITFIFLFITTATGMFLRPPLLVAIAQARVAKIPFSELSDPNPWFDQLRRIEIDTAYGGYLLSTAELMYRVDANFSRPAHPFPVQPPVSVMGITIMKQQSADQWLLGSFQGLFTYNAVTGESYDLMHHKKYVKKKGEKPFSDFKISGISSDFNDEIVIFDYERGATTFNKNKFPSMPEQISNTPMSLWNLALEIHTGRFFRFLLGPLYILIVPLTGIIGLFILISGLIVWWRIYKK